MWPKSSCKDCSDRSVNCHGSCESYKAFRKELDELNLKIEEYRNNYCFNPGRPVKKDPSFRIPTRKLVDYKNG